LRKDLYKMDIKRIELMQNLERFVMDGNGVIVGCPGVGKSFSLSRLKVLLKNKNIPYLDLPIDQLGSGKIEELRSLLSFKGEWSDLILKLKDEVSQLKVKPGILLIDAFDAARNEEIRHRFLTMIRLFVLELRGWWNVIVAVRTYDALKSQELLQLFGEPQNEYNKDYLDPEIKCRNFRIPPLNENEINQAIEQIPNFSKIYEQASSDFKRLLEIPFNIWLIEKILDDFRTLPDISHVKSEVQLLDLFWEKRVSTGYEGDRKESILMRLVERMIAEHSLSLRKKDVDITNDNKFWAELYSNEVLIKVSSTKQRVSFSHNILFDYAVSILVIDDDSKELVKFILKDPSNPVFLRPSFDYYFTRLWHNEPSTFWKIFRDIYLNKNKDLRLFTRLLPPTVIAREARTNDELEPLLVFLKQSHDFANDAVCHILQAHNALQVKRDLLWVKFSREASKYLQKQFAWDIVKLSSIILERAKKDNNDEIFPICGELSRTILIWILEKRKINDSRDWVDRLGALWGVPLVAKTFKSNTAESGKLLDRVLSIANEKKFPIQYFFHLIDNLDSILPHAPHIVAKIYRAVLVNEETSEEKTGFGSPILPFVSTRRQDFQLCQHGLIKHFPGFLKHEPLLAAVTAIGFLNIYILKQHIAGYIKSGVKIDDLKQRFLFRGKEAFYFSDLSYIWDERTYHEEPTEIADEFFRYLYEISKSDDNVDEVASLLDVFRDNVQMAFFWKRLLETGSRSPGFFVPFLFELCIANPIQVGNETIHDLELFLKNASGFFTEDQLIKIENSIHAIPKGECDDEHRKYLELKRNRLLACIPFELLRVKESKKLIDELNKKEELPANEPLFEVSTGSGELTDEIWLQHKGVDIGKAENRTLIDLLKPLGDFVSQWPNKVPDQESVKKILPIAITAYQQIQANSGADKETVDSIWIQLASVAETISRIKMDTKSEEFLFCREILLKSSIHDLPVYQEEYERQFDHPWWTPAPRNEAAQGLPRLASMQPDDEILSAIKKLSRDKVSSVRYLVGIHLAELYQKCRDFFWEILESMSDNEKNSTVQEALCRTLRSGGADNESKAIKVFELLMDKFLSNRESPKHHDDRIFLLVWLSIKRQNQWAIDTINKILDNSMNYSLILSALSFELFKYLEPVTIDSLEKEAEIAVGTLSKLVEVTSKEIQRIQSTPESEISEDLKTNIKEFYHVIDNIVSRLYFKSGFKKGDNDDKPGIPDEQLEKFYLKSKPLLEKLLSYTEKSEKFYLLASTAHYFMQFLNNVLKFDAKGVLHMAAEVAQASKPFGYNLDSLAIREVVKLVETILADHRYVVQDTCSLKDLLNLLDIFAETGWPDAIQLTWRLEEIFR
jgi:hypothetical protein